jgi:chromosome partitioning protein
MAMRLRGRRNRSDKGKRLEDSPSGNGAAGPEASATSVEADDGHVADSTTDGTVLSDGATDYSSGEEAGSVFDVVSQLVQDLPAEDVQEPEIVAAPHAEVLEDAPLSIAAEVEVVEDEDAEVVVEVAEVVVDVPEVPVSEPPVLPKRSRVADEARSSDEPVAVAGEYVPRPLPRIMAVANQKGGVGKTTTAVNLGAALAELGYRVLVIDLDPQGNATTGLGIDAHTFETSMYDVMMRDAAIEDAIEPTSMKNLFVAPSTIDLAGAEIELVPSFSRELKLRKALESVSGDFDFVLIDCPPSLGLITINGLAAAHEVLVPIQCEYYALEGLSQLLRNVKLVQSNLNEGLEVSTIVLTMFDSRTKLAEQVANEVRTHFGSKVCRSVIPRTVRISEAPSFGQPITVFDPSSRGAIAYRELAKEVSGGQA